MTVFPLGDMGRETPELRGAPTYVPVRVRPAAPPMLRSREAVASHRLAAARSSARDQRPSKCWSASASASNCPATSDWITTLSPGPPSSTSLPPPPMQHVVAGAAEDDVVAGAADEDVVAVAAVEHQQRTVRAEARRLDHIVAAETVDLTTVSLPNSKCSITIRLARPSITRRAVRVDRQQDDVVAAGRVDRDRRRPDRRRPFRRSPPRDRC